MIGRCSVVRMPLFVFVLKLSRLMKKVLFLLFALFIAYGAWSQDSKSQSTSFELIALPYATNALEPIISQQTMELHYGKHLRGYVNKLNELVSGTKYEGQPLRAIVRSSGGSIFDNAGQLLNHNLYFLQFVPNGRDLRTTSELAQRFVAQFGSFEEFKVVFEREGMSLFGSGWLWLSRGRGGKLVITKHSNGSNPVVRGLEPLLGIDLWEHAYYLDYQNRRAEHLKALWCIIDWSVIEERYSVGDNK